MTIIKRKSLIVGLISSIVIALVLILTLVGYYIYLELKAEKFKLHYQELLGRTKAKIYSKYIEIEKLDARIENTGVLKGKPIIEGIVTNKGPKDVINLAIKVSFLDNDSAAIYETEFHPQEPALGSSALPLVNIPYISSPTKITLKSNESLVFKKVISNCPTEIFLELREGDRPKRTFGKWSGKLTSQVASLDF